MKPEFELRFYPIHKESLEKSLFRNGALLHKDGYRVLMKRVIFNVNNKQRKWLRIRSEGDRTTITFKQSINSAAIDGTYEHEIVVDNNNFQPFVDLFSILGYKQLSFQESIRTTFSFENCKVTIDEWPGLEPLLEIEGVCAEDVYKAAELLGLYNPFPGDIPEIYKQEYGISLAKFNAIKNLTFENFKNVFLNINKTDTL